MATFDQLRLITPDELQQHLVKKSFWFAIHGLVYDATQYFVDHPGGYDVLFSEARHLKDLGMIFESTMHSQEARDIAVAKCTVIGRLADATPRAMPRLGEIVLPGRTATRQAETDDTFTYVAMTAVALGVAYFVLKRNKVL